MHSQRRSLEFPAESLLSLPLTERLPCSDFREGQHNPRIGYHGIRPAFFRGPSQQFDILLRHLHVDLNGSLHPPCIEQSRLVGNVTKSTKSTAVGKQKRWRDSRAYRRPLSLQRVIASGNWGVDQSSLTYGFHLRGK